MGDVLEFKSRSQEEQDNLMMQARDWLDEEHDMSCVIIGVKDISDKKIYTNDCCAIKNKGPCYRHLSAVGRISKRIRENNKE